MTAPAGGPDPRQFRARSSGPSGSQMAGVGVEFVALIVGGMFGGQWVDRHFHIAPWGLVAGVFLGAILGFVAMLKAVKGAEKSGDSDSPKR